MYLLSHRVLSIAAAAACLILPISSWPVSRGHRPGCSKPDFRQRNYDTVSTIYNLTVYPNNVPIFLGAEHGVPPGLFNQDVVGRVTPVGDFDGFQDSIEYFFALAPIPQGNLARAAITSYKIAEFSSQCDNVAASVVYLYTSIVDPGSEHDGKPLAPLKQVAFWRFDDEGAVLKYDAWIPNLGQWLEIATSNYPDNSNYQTQTILQVCAATQQRCSGTNAQWGSIGECVAALTQKPYGNYDEAWGDNVVCRTIHLVLTQVRPDVHCPHVGPTGGAKCVDNPYVDNYFGDESLYGDPIGETFMCKK